MYTRGGKIRLATPFPFRGSYSPTHMAEVKGKYLPTWQKSKVHTCPHGRGQRYIPAHMAEVKGTYLPTWQRSKVHTCPHGRGQRYIPAHMTEVKDTYLHVALGAVESQNTHMLWVQNYYITTGLTYSGTSE